jgi:ubiquinone/menaquinone biosynthesis C-methylase UbiE
MNCDRIARWYRWLEYAAFGKRLELCRNQYRHLVAGARRVLMLGEGDGRFLKAFTAINACSDIDYVDASGAMLAIARSRFSHAEKAWGRTVRFFRLDVRQQALPDTSYDLIVTHFFLDCLSSQEVRQIISRVASSAAPHARWLISEFRQPNHGTWKYATICVLHVLYAFFRWTGGLETQTLPCYRTALTSSGFVLEREKIFLLSLDIA